MSNFSILPERKAFLEDWDKMTKLFLRKGSPWRSTVYFDPEQLLNKLVFDRAGNNLYHVIWCAFERPADEKTAAAYAWVFAPLAENVTQGLQGNNLSERAVVLGPFDTPCPTDYTGKIRSLSTFINEKSGGSADRKLGLGPERKDRGWLTGPVVAAEMVVLRM
jgi:hypothetical protein